MNEIDSCPFCKESLFPLWSEPSFSKCRSCELIVRNPFPGEKDLEKLYEESWRAPDDSTSETGTRKLYLVPRYADQLLASLNIPNFQGKHILDFGAGRGSLMGALAKSGATPYGVEPYGYEILAKEQDNVFRSLDEIPDEILFDGIVSMDVVEHLRAPWDCIAEMYGKLRPGGWLVISTPNPNGLNARLTKQRWRQSAVTGHIIFMNRKCLAIMFRASGFSEIRSLRWRIRYSDKLSKRAYDLVLQSLFLDGATRIIGFKPS